MSMWRNLLAILLISVATPVSSYAQNASSDAQNLNQITRDQNAQLKRLQYLEQLNASIRSDLYQLKDQSDDLSASLETALGRLAQSESAMNATLESFKEKFDDQNRTIEEVQGLLEKRMNQLMIYVVFGIALVVVIIIFSVRRAMAAAVRKQQANWNSFQEHLFKSK